MTILLLGANGQLGRELRRSLRAVGDIHVATREGVLDDGSPSHRVNLEQAGPLAELLDRLQPSAVVNAAAYTAVDRAESEPSRAFAVNAEIPGQLARWCTASGARLIHYSTDYVFDGRATSPYREDAPTHPLGIYGASKLAGEQAVAATGGAHLIFRTAWVYAAHSHNFLRTMLRLASERDELRVVADQFGSPTPASLIADVTAAALGSDRVPSGTWHLTASGHTSWHGFAEAIFEAALASGLLARVPRVVPITSAQYPTPAARPAWSVLDNRRLAEVLGQAPPHWREGLDSVIAQLAGGQGD